MSEGLSLKKAKEMEEMKENQRRLWVFDLFELLYLVLVWSSIEKMNMCLGKNEMILGQISSESRELAIVSYHRCMTRRQLTNLHNLPTLYRD